MAQGGPRTPSNPAPVSGPGALSQRTDGGPSQPVRPISGLEYGANQELNDIQGAAPMSAGGVAPPAMPDIGLAELSPNLFDPTNHPDRPVTNGMGFGPGAGPEAISAPEPAAQMRLLNALPTLLRAAESPDVSAEFRSMVALIRSAALG